MFHNISFAHPWLLLLLALVPAMIVWYILRYKRIKAPVHIASTDMFGEGGKRELKIGEEAFLPAMGLPAFNPATAITDEEGLL